MKIVATILLSFALGCALNEVLEESQPKIYQPFLENAVYQNADLIASYEKQFTALLYADNGLIVEIKHNRTFLDKLLQGVRFTFVDVESIPAVVGKPGLEIYFFSLSADQLRSYSSDIDRILKAGAIIYLVQTTFFQLYDK